MDTTMDFLIFLLKVSACLVLFYAFYMVALRKLTFFKFNRFYLLSSLLLSFVIPMLQFTIQREIAEDKNTTIPFIGTANEVAFEKIGQSVDAGNSLPLSTFNGLALLPYAYGLVAIGMLLIAIFRLLQLFIYTRGSQREKNGLKLVLKNKGFTNCSFFNYVFIAQDELSEGELAVLLQHEMVHAKQLHSIDKLLMMVIKAILWFNPILYFYDKVLEEAHEYEADETTSQSFGATGYVDLLLKLAVGNNEMPLTHNFVKSPIKQRIMMLLNAKSKRMKKLMYLMVLPLVLSLLWGFTIDIVNVSPNTSEENIFTLVLDAGHGGSQKGIETNGFAEKDLTLIMAKKIQALAEAKGIKVVTTRSGDQTISLKDRAKAQGTILISLHVNSEPVKLGGKRNGIEMFTPTIDQSGDKLSKANAIAGYLHQSMRNVKGINILDRPQQRSMALLNDSQLPGIILELGYLTNPSDFKFITNEQKQNELAASIVDGVIAYQKSAGFETLPKLINSSSLRVDIKNEVIYIKKGKMQIYGGILLADDLTFDQKNKTVTAQNASFTDKEGKVSTGDNFTFDFGKGTYQITTPSGNINPSDKKAMVPDLDNIGYTAKDSIRTNKLTGDIYLYGEAKVWKGDMVYEGANIIYNQQLQTLKVKHNASMYDKSSKMYTASDSIILDLKTSKGILHGVVVQKYTN